MKIVREDLFAGRRAGEVLAVTVNGVLSDGRLVMGAGAAKDALRHFPGMDVQAAKQVRAYGTRKVTKGGEYWKFGWIAWESDYGLCGVFQSKWHWRELSDLALIDYSVAKLLEWIAWNPGIPVRCNFPGIGLGGLSQSVVKPLLAELPDSVTFCVR